MNASSPRNKLALGLTQGVGAAGGIAGPSRPPCLKGPLHRALASSVEIDQLQAQLAAGRALSASMDDAFVKASMLWLAASVRDFLWARDRGDDLDAPLASMRASHARYEDALKAAERAAQ